MEITKAVGMVVHKLPAVSSFRGVSLLCKMMKI